MKENQTFKKRLNRVDYQVSIIIATIVALSFLCVYLYNYNTTYNDMLKSLKDRSDSIYAFVEKNFDKASFNEIKTKESMDKEIYMDHRKTLADVKEATGVRYLYTATKNDEGNFIYVLDGLPMDSSDFRYPGDLIEEEIISNLDRAMSNEIVYPDGILKTEWGKIFISYYPIHDGEKVIGVIGIEFDASTQYDTFSNIRIVTPIIGGVFAFIAILISIVLFRKISNPTFKNMSNTDYLTGLRNRNAFELFMGNIQTKSLENIGILAVDLNNLKKVNDEFGHKEGDQYIIDCSKMLSKLEVEEGSLYRVGGDEFILVYKQASETMLQTQIEVLDKMLTKYNNNAEIHLSIAIGYAIYDENIDRALEDTYNRADQNMYTNKKEGKSKR